MSSLRSALKPGLAWRGSGASGQPLKRYTARTIVDRDALDAELAEIAATGIAWDFEEHAEGICAAGVAFVDPLGRDFALSVPVPASRFAEKRDEVGRAVLAAATSLVDLLPGASFAKHR